MPALLSTYVCHHWKGQGKWHLYTNSTSEIKLFDGARQLYLDSNMLQQLCYSFMQANETLPKINASPWQFNNMIRVPLLTCSEKFHEDICTL